MDPDSSLTAMEVGLQTYMGGNTNGSNDPQPSLTPQAFVDQKEPSIRLWRLLCPMLRYQEPE